MSNMKYSKFFETFDSLIKQGAVFVEFYTNAPMVSVPEHMRALEISTFTFSLQAPVPIRDLAWNEKAVSGYLNFPSLGKQVFCYIPWSAVERILSGSKYPKLAEVIYLNDYRQRSKP